MQVLNTLFKPYPTVVSARYLIRAQQILQRLKQGTHYQCLGGKQIKANNQLVRFKFGSYRLILKRTNSQYEPVELLHRKNFELFLKRRCS